MAIQRVPIQNIHRIISLSIPALISIALLELINVEIYFYGPFAKKENLFILWNLLQLVPAFIFGYISDRNYRKEALIISQMLGVIGGIVLYYFGIKPWVLVLIALTFNPMPVARAALLDNFPHFSTLKIVAITFLAQSFPWIFFKKIGSFHFNHLLIFTFSILIINIFLTFFLFTDRKDLIHPKIRLSDSSLYRKGGFRLIYTLIAFALAELTFYLVWMSIEHSRHDFAWLDLTTLGTLIGIGCAMIYNRLPHMSIITLFYTIGFGITLVAIFTCRESIFDCEISLLSAVSHYSVVGGMYLPFVTEAVINMFGTRHRALGSAMVELADVISLITAPLLIYFIDSSPKIILFLMAFLYFCAVILQKKAEKSRSSELNSDKLNA